MKAFICLAISMLLVGLLYVYVRQQFALIETHVNELKGIIKMLALPPPEPEAALELKVEKRPAEELVCVSDDSADSDEETDEEPDEDADEETEVEESEPMPAKPQVAHVMMQGHDLMQLMQQMSFPGAFQFDQEHEPALEIEEVTDLGPEPVDITEVHVPEPGSDKIVVLGASYEHLSVKELREKVQSLGGPSLKTKKQLVEYLEKNVSV